MAGLVHPQLESAREIGFRFRHLLGRDGFVAKPGEFDEDRVEGCRKTLGVDPGRDLERSRVGVVHEPRRDVVGKALRLANGQEQPARHPVTEDRVQDGEDPRIRVVAAERRHPDDQLGLARVAAGFEERPLARRELRRRREPGNRAIAGAEGRRRELDRLGVLEVARDGDDGVRRPVHGSPEAADRVRWQGPDAVLVAADLAAQGARPEHRLLEEGLGVLGRIIKVGADLLDDDGALAVDLLLVEVGADDQLAEDVHRARRLAARNADPVDGRLAVGRGIEGAANAFDRFRDRAGRGKTLRALEGDVLHEVGNPCLGRGLETRTGEDVRRDGDRTGACQPGADHARPTGQRGTFEHRGRWYRTGRNRPGSAGRRQSTLSPGSDDFGNRNCRRTRNEGARRRRARSDSTSPASRSAAEPIGPPDGFRGGYPSVLIAADRDPPRDPGARPEGPRGSTARAAPAAQFR